MKDIIQDTRKTQEKFLKKAISTIAKFDMLGKKERVLVGVSGGPDSVALLNLLLMIKQKCSLEHVGIAHLNHMLRDKEADRDENFVKKIAKNLNIPCFIEKKNVAAFAKKHRLSIEDGARRVRYRFLKEIFKSNQYSKIALGHNKDDNAELILMNILRGSGTKGLSGIPPKREGIIIRPLIEISKKEIYEFLKSINKTYVMDSTNNKNIYLRNSIRNNLIPLIEENYNPKIKESLIRLSNIIKDEDEWMEKETDISFTKVLESVSPDDVNPDTIQLSLKLFLNCHLALQKRIMRKAIKIINRDLKKITLNHIEDAIKLLISKSSGESIDLPDQIRIYKHNKSFFVKKESFPLRELGEKRKNTRKTC